jgi:hypothetical protein
MTTLGGKYCIRFVVHSRRQLPIGSQVWQDKYRAYEFPLPLVPALNHEHPNWRELFVVQYKRMKQLDHNWRHEKPSMRSVVSMCGDKRIAFFCLVF